MNHTADEKLIEVAAQILKTLAHSDSMTDSLLDTFSAIDDRLSREKLSHKMSHASVLSPFDDALRSLDRRISRLSAADHSIWSDPGDASAFLDSLDELCSFILDWSPMADDKPVAVSLVRAEDLLQKAMSRLEVEFKIMLEQGGDSFDLARNGESTPPGPGGEYSYGYFSEEEEDDVHVDGLGEAIPVAHPVTDYNILIEALPPGTIGDLNEIAKRMVVARYEKECSRVYSACRREFLEESMSRLGLQKFSVEEVQKMPWNELEDEIERWAKAANVALRILFPSERRLCERVFFGFPSSSDLSFMEVCRGSTIQLLNFAEAVATNSRAPERLFKVLDMYETLRDLLTEFELLFSNQYCAILRAEAISIWTRLGESIRGIFMELENLIRRDPAKQAGNGGGVHPITRYVMNYIRAACKSRQTLERLFEQGVVSGGGYRNMDGRVSTTSLSVQIVWITELLESNLEAKARTYKDIAMSSVFMLNNGRYIIEKVKDSELRDLLGDDWIKKHNAKERQLHMNYQRSSWNKVLGALKLDGSTTSDMANMPLRERISVFNSFFDEVIRAQSSWVISDPQLKEDLKVAASGTLIPAYRNFLVRIRNAPEVGRNPERYITYSVEDIDARIKNELFRGTGGRQ